LNFTFSTIFGPVLQNGPELQNTLQQPQHLSSTLTIWYIGTSYAENDDAIFYLTKTDPQSVAALK
jgi:hypothetical protein